MMRTTTEEKAIIKGVLVLSYHFWFEALIYKQQESELLRWHKEQCWGLISRVIDYDPKI
jgi:hypothetical protein